MVWTWLDSCRDDVSLTTQTLVRSTIVDFVRRCVVDAGAGETLVSSPAASCLAGGTTHPDDVGASATSFLLEAAVKYSRGMHWLGHRGKRRKRRSVKSCGNLESGSIWEAMGSRGAFSDGRDALTKQRSCPPGTVFGLPLVHLSHSDE